MKKRVVFTFDTKSLEALKEMAGEESLATGLRNSIMIMSTLQRQAALGFTDLIVRNLHTDTERTLIIPSLHVSK